MEKYFKLECQDLLTRSEMCLSIWNQGMNIYQESSLAKHSTACFECVKLFNLLHHEGEIRVTTHLHLKDGILW